MLISQSIPNLVNGVSQQPFTLRLASQAELQENGLSTTSQGLRKRPPTKHLKKILTGSYTNAYIHTINRDENERYIVVITNGGLKVFDLNGNEKTVNFPNGAGYLAATDPATSFRAVTVADYTFLVNKNITVNTSSATSPVREKEALINIKAGNYGKTYKIIIDGITVASYLTPDGSQPSHTSYIATDFIASTLINGVATAVVDPVTGATTTVNVGGLNQSSIIGANGWTVTQYGSVIHIKKASGDFSIRCEDGFNNGAMLAIKDQIQKFSDLPANAGVEGFALEVVGDKQTGFDNFWVRFDSTGSGSWRETIKPGTRLGVDGTTMPHTLIRNSDGTFTLAAATWNNRKVGTLESNSDPSFVTRKITDVFFYRNRLGILADEAVIFSEASEFFNFYRTTVTELLDSDPIDVTVSHTKVSTLQYAVPFNRQLLLFSAQTQFIVDAGELLTPKTISIKQATEFESDIKVKPQGIGKNVYFAVPKGEYTGVREYFPVDEVQGVNDSTEITGHVPKYIPSQAFKIAPCLTEDLMVLLSKSERNALWVYKFFFNNNEKLQSSWSKWTFEAGDVILNVDFILSDLVLVIQRSDGVFLEKLSVSLGDIGSNEPYNVHLDRKITVAKSHLSYAAGYTIIPQAYLPGSISVGSWEAIIANGQGKEAGIRLPVEYIPSGARIKGNFTDCDLIVGRKYVFKYEFSAITVKQPAGNAMKSDTIGRLQLRTMQINYSDSGYFKVLVTPSGRSTYEYTFSGKTLGLASSTIGLVELDTGDFQFPILAQNTGVTVELLSDAPLPCSFLSADWEGMYVKRSKGM
jgi:hypothetical protein